MGRNKLHPSVRTHLFSLWFAAVPLLFGQVCERTVGELRRVMGEGERPRPIFGICLGHQLLAAAAGFSTYKLKYLKKSHGYLPFLSLFIYKIL
jgi:hypothetical protein